MKLEKTVDFERENQYLTQRSTFWGKQARRTGYFLGVAVRLTAKLVTFPFRYRADANLTKQVSSINSDELSIGDERHVAGAMARVKSRLKSLEHRLGNSLKNDSYDSVPPSRHRDRVLTNELANSIFAAIQDLDPQVRKAALNMIGKYAGDDIGLLIIEALNDSDEIVRVAGAEAAGRTKLSSAVFPLMFMLDDPSGEVRKTAHKAIEKIINKRVKFRHTDNRARRRENINEIMDWWKKERFSKLASSIERTLTK